jgi:hypothetical protein
MARSRRDEQRARQDFLHILPFGSLHVSQTVLPAAGAGVRCVAVPFGRTRKRYTRDELVRAENQVRKERQSSHGPIMSVR